VENLLGFVAVVAVIVVVPGPDMALILRHGLARGRRGALETATGVSAGLLVWAVAAALGLAAILAASAPAFTVLKLAGAAYLVWLGLRALHEAWRGSVELDEPRGRRSSSPFRQGLTTNLLNPKVALVFTTLIPQFVGRNEAALPEMLLFAGIFVGMGFVWLAAYALLVGRLAEVLGRPRPRRIVNAVSGTVLTALGARLAFERRS
jgi:threonine/homoserine/homoserine lactone efflux protein